MSKKAFKGYYSLIQYCPDLGRLEAANIGVLLFCPDLHFIKATTSRSNSRIKRFFGSEGHDWVRINSFKKGLEDRITLEGAGFTNLEDLLQFIDQRANLLQITAPRPMKVYEPDQEFEELRKEFLNEVSRRNSSKSLKRLLTEKLDKAGLEKKLRRDIKVSVPVLQKEVEIPFGFQNGRFNLINPVRFEALHPDQSVATACKYAVEGRSLYDNPDPLLGQLQLVIVGKFRSGDNDSPTRIQHVFQNYGVKLFRASELPLLIDEIRNTGKDI